MAGQKSPGLQQFNIDGWGNEKGIPKNSSYILLGHILENQKHKRRDSYPLAWLLKFPLQYFREVGISLRLATLRWFKDEAGTLSAAVAYYLALSVFPLILLLSSGIGVFLKFTNLGEDARQTILAVVSEHCSPALEQQIQAILTQFEDQSLVGGPLGLLLALLAAIGVFYQFERAFEKIWGGKNSERAGIVALLYHILIKRLVALTMLVGVGLAIIVILLANVVLATARGWMSHMEVPGSIAIWMVDACATVLLNSIVFAFLYRFLPTQRVLWLHALRSGFLAALIWELSRKVLISSLIGTKYTTTYGVIGSFIVLLLWFYWGVAILLFGAEYLQIIASKGHADVPASKTD